MEPAEAWVPCDFQLANWTMEPATWAPGFPVESESTEIYCSSIQTCVPNSGGGQLIEYYEATTHYPIEKAAQESFEVVLHKMEMEIYNNPIRVFEEVAHKFEADIDMIKVKIHRYPPSIRDLDDWYTVPMIVAIGPYHHNREELKLAEQVKHVAVYNCIRESGCSVLDLYSVVAVTADEARSLYDKDAMASISIDDFRHMMFFDACFLVQYMAWYASDEEVHPSLRSFFYSNHRGTRHDLLLLENQLPWRVVEIVLRFRPLPLEEFVAPWRGLLQDRRRRALRDNKSFTLDDSYKPPHLLGLLRYYIVGSRKLSEPPKNMDKVESVSYSISAIKRAEIGISLTANETTELINMGLNKKGIFTELSLAPLSLNYSRASRLVNMEAFELCTIPSFLDADFEDSAVCSYLRLLSMLVQREEDMHKLRTKGILQGGAGLTNKQVVGFFTSLQSLPNGFCYAITMVQIETYRFNKRRQTMAHTYFHKKKKTICTVLSTIVAVVSIFGTLVGILVKLKPLKAAP